ncbi:hypothetical protein DFQ30_003518 [Apophysomyces sp. BC1015]|nr:hypothetical protein DFQ30_003518 [Apophysomyces sp. BC1015]
MAMPVQAATAIFSPQPIRPPLKKENNQEDDTWLSRAGDTPSILSSVFEGWPSFVLSSPSPPPDDEHIKSETRPPNPSPPSPDSVDYQSARSESLDSTTSHEHKHKQHKKSHRRQRSSIAIGNEVNDLLNKDHVRKAISVLQEAVSWMHMTDDPGQSPGSVAKIYSRMLKTLCEPNLSSVVNEISGVDPKEPGAIYNCVVWRLFTKVVESGYTLETPKQVEEAEWLLSDYGKPFIEVTNPLALTDLPPLHIETPIMDSVTDHDRFKLWMYYQTALSGTDWALEKDQYETKRRATLSALELQKERRRSLTDKAMRWMSMETEPERMEREKIDTDNTMIYTALRKKQFEYGWQVYAAMDKAVNEFTPRVAVHLCWRAFSETPISNVSRRIEWESRAWAVYSRFMCSEFLHPDQAETPGFLRDLLSITATSAESRNLAKYTKVMSVYHTLERLQMNNLMRDEHVITPIFCAFLHECQGTPTTIMAMCHKAFEIWHKKRDIDASLDLAESNSFSMYWSLIIFSLKSGDAYDFAEILNCLDSESTPTPSSLLAAIQTFHDRYLQCGQKANQEAECYFDQYLFRPIKYTDDAADHQVEEMDEWGFVGQEAAVTQGRRNSDMAEPMAYIDHALHKRTSINEVQAGCLARAVAMGAARDENLQQKTMYVTRNKGSALVRHCLQLVGNKGKRMR